MKYSFINHYNYHVWAQKRLVAVLQALDNELFFKEQESSFPSIAKTALHIWDVDIVWSKRLLEGISLDYWPSSVFTGGKDAILEGMIRSAEKIADFIKDKDEQFLYSPVAYHSVEGKPYQTDKVSILFQIVNHASYHRGQIVTLLRQVGVNNIPSLDLIVYLRL